MTIIDEKLLDEFRAAGRCEFSGAKCDRREPHHLIRKGMGGKSRMDVRINLISLGLLAHRMIHDGNIAHRVVLEIVAKREKLTVDELQEKLWELQRTPNRPIAGGER